MYWTGQQHDTLRESDFFRGPFRKRAAGLYGEDAAYICPELERRIAEALIQDDRITSVEDFEFEVSAGMICVNFTVHTIYGDVQEEKVVKI